MVSITSQGQISIPASIRRKLGLDRSRKAVVTEKNGKLYIEPVKDLLDLKGSFKTHITASPKEIRSAFEEYIAKKSV